MANVRILTPCIVGGAPHSAGDTVNVSDADAATLVGIGRAMAAPDSVAPAPPTPPAKPIAPATPAKPTRTKAEIEIELEIAKAAEEALKQQLAEAAD